MWLDALTLLTCVTLAAVAALHVYWGVGGLWPAKNTPALAALVLGPGARAMPGLLASTGVAAGLLATAALLLAAHGVFPLPVPADLQALATWGAIGVLGLRGLGGFFQAALQPALRGSTYARANARVYSPLCTALAAAGAAIVLF